MPEPAAENEAKPVPVLEVHLEHSVWSICVVIGVEKSIFNGFFDSFISALLVFFSVLIQVLFTVVLIMCFPEDLPDAQGWRAALAHDAQRMDLAGRSLAQRACAGEGHIGAYVKSFDVYLGSAGGSELPAFRPGTVLCILSVLLWSLSVLTQMRQMWMLLQGIYWLPNERTSTLEPQLTIAKGRLRTLIFLFALRGSLVACLWIVGIRLLVLSSPIEMLLLTAALPMILHVDKYFFHALMPEEVKLGIQRFQKLVVKYRRFHSQVEGFLGFAVLIAALILTQSQLLGPLEQKKLDLRQELCGGNLDFVVGYNIDSQLTYGMVPAERPAARLALKEAFRSAEEQTSLIWSPRWQEDLWRSMATEAERWRCEDNATLLQSGESCEELRHRCEDKEARLVRLACPVTCGCADNMASPWYKVASQGCPTQCQAFLNSTCDEPSNETWGNLWDDYAAVAQQDVLQTIEAMKSEGCSHLQTEPLESVTGANWCDGHPDFFRSFAWLCPRSCGRCS